MTGLLLIAHEPLASALASVARHVFPDCGAGLRALDVAPGMSPEDVARQALQLLSELSAAEVLVLTDVFGATPCNVAERLAAQDRRLRVVAGVSVPMLWRALCYAGEPVDQLLERALQGAAQGAIPVGSAAPPMHRSGAADPRRHDQQSHHHQ